MPSKPPRHRHSAFTAEQAEKNRKRDVDRRRGSAAERGYGARWQRLRKEFLRAHPLCVRCMDLGSVRSADVVDHIKPHKGNKNLFWDQANWQALCASCHNRKTATEDSDFARRE